MSWRTVVITKHCKLSYKNGYMVVRGEDTTLIHLSEMRMLILDTTSAVISSYLISELMKQKIKILFCDEKRNPQGEVISYYDSYQSSKRIHDQINWDKEFLMSIWTNIIKRKILSQSDLLKKYNLSGASMLLEYMSELLVGDPTSREGHAAKVYFNSLFGKDFNRRVESDLNIALNYGYSLILSCVNKEISASGYLTQLGFKHSNMFNYFNLSSDLMEPFRIFVDEVVYLNGNKDFNHDFKLCLLELLSKEIIIDGKKQILTNAIAIYVKSVFAAIEKMDIKSIKYPEYE